MKKDVKVSIKGMHYLDSNPDAVELICQGTRYEKNGKTYILYEEVVSADGEDIETVRNSIKVEPDKVEVIKRGKQGTHLVFREGDSHVTCYYSPYGNMMVSVTTSSLMVNTDEDDVKIQAVYDLDINNVQVSRCNLEICAN